VFIPPADFNHQTTWNAMQDFYRTLNQLHEHHWAQAMSFNNYDETENGADESMLSAYRIDFYLPSSP
jgi:hypothetical protein